MCAPTTPVGPQGLPAEAGRAPPGLHLVFLTEVPHTPKCGRCHTLVHEFGHEQPETIKELLEITTRHASGEEAVRAAFALVEAVVTTGGG
jgi:hypothetical protein